MPNVFAHEGGEGGGVKNSKNYAYIVHGWSLKLLFNCILLPIFKKIHDLEWTKKYQIIEQIQLFKGSNFALKAHL